MADKSHPVWLLLGILIIGGLGLGYCQLMYHNGADPLKDGGLIAIVGGLAGVAGRFVGAGTPKQ